MKDCSSNPRSKSYRCAKSFKKKNDYNPKLNKLLEESYISFVARNFALRIEEMRPIRKKCSSDSGANADMCDGRNLFDDMPKSVGKTSVSVGDSTQADVLRIGTITSVVVCNVIKRTSNRLNVLQAPHLVFNPI